MPKFKPSITVQTPQEIIAGLDADHDQASRQEREFVTRQRDELTRADGRLRDASARVDALARDVPAGKAALADLDAALRAQQAAALVMPGHQARVAEAEAAEVVAKKQADAKVLAEANRRGKALQDVADELAPILTALRDAEAGLDTISLRHGGSGVPPVTWPQSAEDEGALRKHAVIPATAR